MSDFSQVHVVGKTVVEANGQPAMNGRNRSDGGGCPDVAAANQLASAINDRRKRSAERAK
jgi:hypothetical protein